jgi:tetratricopeptide (TPR) repeat protein
MAAGRQKNFYLAWYYRGVAAEKDKAMAEAAQAYQRALSINPDYKPALEGLSRVKRAKS